MQLRIICEPAGLDCVADLNDSSTAAALAAIVPVNGSAQRWGDEVYFTVPMHHEPEDAVENVTSGEIAYWPPGDAFCIFFGQQPISAVNPVGRIRGDLAGLRRVEDGVIVRLEPIEE